MKDASSSPPGTPAHDVEQGVVVTARASGNLSLQIGIGPAAQRRGVVEDLSDHRSARVGIPPEFGFEHDQLAFWRGVERVHVARGRVQFLADGNGAGKGAVDLLDRKCLRMFEQQVPEPGFIVFGRRAGAGKPNLLQHVRLAGRGDGDRRCVL